MLFRTTFIAITGGGKTTAKDCLAAILSSRHPAAEVHLNRNGNSGVPGGLLRVRPWHRFAVLEVTAGRPGLIRRNARLVRPHMALVLEVAPAGAWSFRGLEEIADEKAQLLAALHRHGTAVLNGDDPRVADMAQPERFRVIRFGSSPCSYVWAGGVRTDWPEGVSFRVHKGEESCDVRTGLIGAHEVMPVLGAVTAATACGIGLEAAARAVQPVRAAFDAVNRSQASQR